MDYVTNCRLNKNLRLSIASSVDSSQSNLWILFGFRSLYGRWDLSLLLASTVDTLTVVFLALFCKQERECSRLSHGPHFLNLRSLRPHWSMRWAGPGDVVLPLLGYTTKDLWELSPLENLRFVTRGRFLCSLHNFQHLVAGISHSLRSSSLV